MKNKHAKEAGLLTEKRTKFVNVWAGCSIAAAKAAGYSSPKRAAEQLMKDSTVTRLLRRKLETMAEESGKMLAQQIKEQEISPDLP